LHANETYVTFYVHAWFRLFLTGFNLLTNTELNKLQYQYWSQP